MFLMPHLRGFNGCFVGLHLIGVILFHGGLMKLEALANFLLESHVAGHQSLESCSKVLEALFHLRHSCLDGTTERCGCTCLGEILKNCNIARNGFVPCGICTKSSNRILFITKVDCLGHKVAGGNKIGWCFDHYFMRLFWGV